ncbi:MAG: hypothetical protein Kow00107_05880 [Planctomycetota bacterium]
MLKGKDLLILLLAVTCAFLVGMLVGKDISPDLPPAFAQGSANGMIAVTGRIDQNRDRLYLVDTEKKVICVYDNFNGRFRLCGIHSYRYDVEFNSSAGDKQIEDNKSGGDFEYMKKKFQEK